MEYVALGDYIRLLGGGTPSKDVESYWNGGIPWASVKDLKSDRINKTVDEISQEGVDNSATKVVPAGSLIIATRMAVGKVAITDIDLAINQDLKAVNCSDELDSMFLFYLLKSKENYFNSVSSGATVKGIKIEHIARLKIPLPPLPVQQKIAAILDEADKLRQLNKQLIAKYDELTQSLFLDMFGDPVANHMGWVVNRMKDLSVQIGSGNTPKGGSKVYVNEGITFFRSQNVWKNRLELDNVAYITDATHQNMGKSSLKTGDILMTKTGRINTENSSLGRAAMYLGADDQANVNGHVYLIRLKEDVINEFVLHILTTNEYREHIRRVCVGGIDKRQLNKDHLEDFPIICPPKKQQLEFVKKLKAINKLKEDTHVSLKKSEDLFNSLLQRAFKGELVS